MNSPFVKPGCTCKGCRVYGEHPKPADKRHVITLTHGPGTDSLSCECGWLHTDWPDKVGAAIFAHRQEGFATAVSWRERWA